MRLEVRPFFFFSRIGFTTNPKQKRQKKREREGEKGVDIFPAKEEEEEEEEEEGFACFVFPGRRSGCLLPKGV